jgi:hypothetical protein
MTKQTKRQTTLKVKDLVTGKTMTVEEWKARRKRIEGAITDDNERSYGPWYVQQNATHERN